MVQAQLEDFANGWVKPMLKRAADADIDLDELGVPEEIATNLTFPEIVNPYNRDRLLSYVRNGPDKHPGAKSVYIKRDKAASEEVSRNKNADKGDDEDILRLQAHKALSPVSTACAKSPSTPVRRLVAACRACDAAGTPAQMNLRSRRPAGLIGVSEPRL